MVVEEILNNWLTQARYNSYIDSFEFDVLDSSFEKKRIKVTKELVETNPYLVYNNTRSGRLEWTEYEHLKPTIKSFRKHNPLVQSKPKYKVLDFDDNILGEAFDLDSALEIFNQRYAYFRKQDALQFIEEI